MNKNLERLQKENQGIEISAETVYFIGRETLVTKKFIAKDMQVSERHILNWEKQGFESSPYTLPRMKLYDINALKKWHKENINQKTSPDDEEDYRDGDTITTKNAKKAKELEEAKLKRIDREISEIKLKEATGEYIRADDVDKITTEMAVILLSSWRNLLETLPSILVNKTQSEVYSILDTEFEAEVNALNKQVNS